MTEGSRRDGLRARAVSVEIPLELGLTPRVAGLPSVVRRRETGWERCAILPWSTHQAAMKMVDVLGLSCTALFSASLLVSAAVMMHRVVGSDTDLLAVLKWLLVALDDASLLYGPLPRSARFGACSVSLR